MMIQIIPARMKNVWMVFNTVVNHYLHCTNPKCHFCAWLQENMPKLFHKIIEFH